MKSWNSPADEPSLQKVKTALEHNGFTVSIVETQEEARKKVLELIPQGAEVMNMTSVTLDTISASAEVNESGRFSSVRNALNSMSREKQGREMQRLGAAPEWVIGSVHAVTKDGHALIASNSGSQLPAYAYGSDHVIWVVGSQKIVKNTEEGMKRIYEYTLPLESERAKKAYGVPGSFVSKLLIVNRENKKGRIHIILVKTVLGY